MGQKLFNSDNGFYRIWKFKIFKYPQKFQCHVKINVNDRLTKTLMNPFWNLGLVVISLLKIILTQLSCNSMVLVHFLYGPSGSSGQPVDVPTGTQRKLLARYDWMSFNMLKIRKDVCTEKSLRRPHPRTFLVTLKRYWITAESPRAATQKTVNTKAKLLYYSTNEIVRSSGNIIFIMNHNSRTSWEWQIRLWMNANMQCSINPHEPVQCPHVMRNV